MRKLARAVRRVVNRPNALARYSERQLERLVFWAMETARKPTVVRLFCALPSMSARMSRLQHRLALHAHLPNVARKIEGRTAENLYIELRDSRLLWEQRGADVCASPANQRLDDLARVQIGVDVREASVHTAIRQALLHNESGLAADLIQGQLESNPYDIDTFRHLITVDRAHNASAARVHAYSLKPANPAELGVLATMMWELGECQELIAFGENNASELGDRGRYTVGLAKYVLRDFSGARHWIKGQFHPQLNWATDKLRSRMLLEEGSFENALASRRRSNRIADHPDEVEYVSLLNLGRFAEAARIHTGSLHRRALLANYLDRASTNPSGQAVSRFVISQNGPGDEIQAAGWYSLLLETTETLAVTSDPRLLPLMKRSFPTMRFFASERLGESDLVGFLSGPTRAQNSLFGLLTAEADQASHNYQAVLLGRSLQQLSGNDWPRPRDPYLKPDPQLSKTMAHRLGSSPLTIGVAWRSELVGGMRSIHYLTPSDLEPLSTLGGRYVCMQYDAAEAERETLKEVLGDVLFLDDLDLRDDFDVVAAIATNLDLMIAPLISTAELVAAVGTPTILLAPTPWGSWRKRDPDGQDTWYKNARVAVPKTWREPSTCVQDAAAIAARLLTGPSRP